MEHKNVPVSSVRGVDGVDGIVEAIVSVTNIVDSVNDVIVPGAYKNTLRKRNPKGVWSHDTNVPVAKTLKVEELMPGDERLPEDLRAQDAGALLVKMQFNLNTTRGRDAFHDVQFFAEEQEWSIGYSVPEGKASVDDKTGIRFIKALELYEYSPVIFGAAPGTRALSIKDDLSETEDMEEDLIDESKQGDYSDLDFRIPAGVKKQAEIGLRWSREYNRGGTSVGKNTANYLINNSDAAPRQVRHIARYFPRHEVDLRTPANSKPGADGYPGAGLIAWKLWGGDEGRRWATKLVEAMNRRDEMKAAGIKAEPGDLRVGDFVVWNSSGGRARGRITRILRRGTLRVPDSSFTINATAEDPAALIRIYREEGTQWVATDVYVGHRFSTLTRIESLAKDVFTDMPEGPPGSFGTPERPGVVGRQPRRRRRTDEGKPYRISRNISGCSGYAVVKEGESVAVPGGCHETMAEARQHMAALYAAEAPKGFDGADEGKQEVGHGRTHPNLTADERALHDALVRIADEYGKFDEDGSGIWAGYETPAENDEKSIGVKCANCTLYNGSGSCSIIKQRVEENGKCRFAVIPDGVVQWNDMKSYAEAQKEWDDSEEGIDWDAIEAKASGGPIRSHSTPVSDRARLNRQAILSVRSPAEPDYYRKIFAYQYPNTDGDHFVSEDGRPGAAAMSELRVQMSVLNGGRTGTTLRGADRKAVYNHLARHYRDFGATPPSLKSDSDVDTIMMKKGLIDKPLTPETKDER